MLACKQWLRYLILACTIACHSAMNAALIVPSFLSNGTEKLDNQYYVSYDQFTWTLLLLSLNLKIAHACSYTMHIALIFLKISYKQTTEE